MTPEQLLQPRYIVIADYPFASYNVGDIIPTYETAMAYVCKDQDEWSGKGCMADYPVIFKKLNWWDDRNHKELPLYVKKKYTGVVFKVDGWQSSPNTGQKKGAHINITGDYWTLFVENLLPSSEDEYNEYFQITIKDKK